MHPKRGWTLLLVFFLAAPSTTGQSTDTQATFLSTAVAWESGESDLSGSVVALRSRVNILSNSSSMPSAPSALESRFELRADRVDVETDTTERYLETPAAFFYNPAPLVAHDAATYHHAVIQGKESEADRFLYIFPSPAGSITAATPCASASRHAVSELREVPMINSGRPASTADVSSTLAIQACPDASLTIAGSFRVALWQWNSTLAASEGSTFLWSGKAANTLAAAAPYTNSYAGPGQQVYLTVTNGTFTLAGSSSFPLVLYMEAPVVQDALQARLAGGSGKIPALGKEVAGHDILLAGRMRLGLGQAEQGVGVTVEEGLDAVEVDGQRIQVPSLAVLSPKQGMPVALAGGIVGAVLMSAAAMVPVVRRARAARPQRLEDLVEKGRDLLCRGCTKEACEVAEKILDLKQDHPQGHYLMAVSLGYLHEVSRALAHHRRASELLRRMPKERGLLGENALQAARTVAFARDAGSREEVVKWLGEAVEAKPELREELHRHAELHPFLREVGLPAPDDVAVG